MRVNHTSLAGRSGAGLADRDLADGRQGIEDAGPEGGGWEAGAGGACDARAGPEPEVGDQVVIEMPFAPPGFPEAGLVGASRSAWWRAHTGIW